MKWKSYVVGGLLLMFALDAAVNDYQWPDEERLISKLRPPSVTYSRVATAQRPFSILRPWGLIRPTLSDVWYVDEREIMNLDESVILLEVLKYGRGLAETVRMGIDLDAGRCVILPWENGDFEGLAKSYVQRGLIINLQPCQDSPLMQNAIEYLRTDFRKRIAPALTFLRVFRQRVAAQPTADDINVLSMILTLSPRQIADPSEGLKLFCDVLVDAEKGGRVFVVVPKMKPNEDYAPEYLHTWAERHGRIPIDNVPKCMPVTRASIRWQESLKVLPGNWYNWYSPGKNGRVLLQGALAAGTLDVLDGKYVLDRREIVAKVEWPFHEEYASSDGAPPETAKKREAVEKLHEQLSATLVPKFVTPAARLTRGDGRTTPRLQETFCFALARIMRGHLADGMDIINHLPSVSLPSDKSYITRASDYFNNRVTAPKDSAVDATSPVCSAHSVLINIMR
jgi:hypothetical protein